ncbi:unnamed protein product [Urochloa humidicola]
MSYPDTRAPVASAGDARGGATGLACRQEARRRRPRSAMGSSGGEARSLPARHGGTRLHRIRRAPLAGAWRSDGGGARRPPSRGADPHARVATEQRSGRGRSAAAARARPAAALRIRCGRGAIRLHLHCSLPPAGPRGRQHRRARNGDLGVKPLIDKLERREAKEAAAADEGCWSREGAAPHAGPAPSTRARGCRPAAARVPSGSILRRAHLPSTCSSTATPSSPFAAQLVPVDD